MAIDGSDPLSQEFAFRLLFLVVLPFYFQHKRFSVGKPDEVVRAEFPADTSKRISDLESKMVIFDPRRHVRASIQFEGLAGFPTAVEDGQD